MLGMPSVRMKRVERRPVLAGEGFDSEEAEAEALMRRFMPILRPSQRLVVPSVRRPSMVLVTPLFPASSIFVRVNTVLKKRNVLGVRDVELCNKNLGNITERNEGDSVIWDKEEVQYEP
jgi:hypothetical protein